jgi:aminoglycoside phosphotransferase (APT) family kinase protein
MDDCGEGLPTLKTFLMEHKPSGVQAESIGHALGAFLADLHASRDEATLRLLSRNELGKALSAFVTYGRLVATLNGEHRPDSLKNPALDVTPTDIEKIDAVAKETIAAITTNHHETITMGDFWTGNILVHLSAEGTLERLWVVDWELAKPSLAGLDVGQMVAEMALVRGFVSGTEEAVEAAVIALWRAYRAKAGSSASEVGKVARRHVGAHFVAWTPRTPTWGPKARVRAVVQEGVKLLSGSDEDHWLFQALS